MPEWVSATQAEYDQCQRTVGIGERQRKWLPVMTNDASLQHPLHDKQQREERGDGECDPVGYGQRALVGAREMNCRRRLAASAPVLGNPNRIRVMV